jgi:hypothetical protein
MAMAIALVFAWVYWQHAFLCITSLFPGSVGAERVAQQTCTCFEGEIALNLYTYCASAERLALVGVFGCVGFFTLFFVVG